MHALIMHTGERCPMSGTWRALGLSTTIYIALNSLMPSYHGLAVSWRLVDRS